MFKWGQVYHLVMGCPLCHRANELGIPSESIDCLLLLHRCVPFCSAAVSIKTLYI